MTVTTCTPVPVEGVEVQRQGGDQGLALAGAHLGDLALVQHDAADQLHVEVAQADRARGRLAHRREGLRQQLVQRLAGRQALAKMGGPIPDLLVGQRLELGLECA